MFHNKGRRMIEEVPTRCACGIESDQKIEYASPTYTSLVYERIRDDSSETIW